MFPVCRQRLQLRCSHPPCETPLCPPTSCMLTRPHDGVITHSLHSAFSACSCGLRTSHIPHSLPSPPYWSVGALQLVSALLLQPAIPHPMQAFPLPHACVWPCPPSHHTLHHSVLRHLSLFLSSAGAGAGAQVRATGTATLGPDLDTHHARYTLSLPFRCTVSSGALCGSLNEATGPPTPPFVHT